MSHPEDTPRQKFADWVAGVAEAHTSQEDWTMSEFIAASGCGRNTIYRWMDRTDTKEPSIEKVKTFCDRLGIDFAIPAVLLGWLSFDMNGFEGKVRRARILLSDPRTPEADKVQYRAILRSAELLFDAAFHDGDEEQRRRA